jgi:hypothetical protein
MIDGNLDGNAAELCRTSGAGVCTAFTADSNPALASNS